MRTSLAPLTSTSPLHTFPGEVLMTPIHSSPKYFEGTCISDPCWYYVEGATGREAIIFDLYPDTGELSMNVMVPVLTIPSAVKNIVAKRIVPVTMSLALPRVMCNSTTVNCPLSSMASSFLTIELGIGRERCWIQVPKWPFRPHEGWYFLTGPQRYTEDIFMESLVVCTLEYILPKPTPNVVEV